MKFAEQPARSLTRTCNAVFYLTLAALVAFILWLPAFPNGDGPLHSYYANTFGELASGHTSYSQFYAIRHLVQPYCIHYFSLILFGRWFSLLKAEEIFVSIILVNAALAFRFMARGFGQQVAVVSLFMLPLLLNWSLSAGFLNFCLGMGLAFWAIGLWNRLPPDGSPAALLGFSGVLVLLVFTHPVPLLVLVLIAGCDLALLAWQRRTALKAALAEGLWWRALALGLSCLAVIVPLALAEKSKVVSVWRDFFPHRSVFLHLIEARSLGYFAAGSPLVWVYALGLLLLFPATVLLLQRDSRARWKAGTAIAADRQLLILTLFLLSTITMPRTVGGGANFSERMWDLGWPMLMAAAASLTLTVRAQRRLAIVGVALIVLTAVIAVPRLRTFSRNHAELSSIALPRDEKGLLLEPMSTTEVTYGSSYPIYWWSGVRAFTASHAVLWNSPWLDQNQIPLRLHTPSVMPGAYIEPSRMEQPAYLTRSIASRNPDALRALHSVNFLLYVAPNEKTEALYGQMQRVLGIESGEWQCKAQNIYVLCLRR